MTELNDFRYVCKLLTEFCKRERVIETLKSIDKHDLTGWEKWMQVEFSVFIAKRHDIKNWKREYPYLLDKRKSSNDKAFTDFSFRKRFTDTQSRIALEFKAHRNCMICVNGMVKDWEKLDHVRQSDDDMRSLWVVGFHMIEEHQQLDDLKDRIRQQVKKRCHWELGRNRLEIIPIMQTRFAVTVF